MIRLKKQKIKGVLMKPLKNKRLSTYLGVDSINKLVIPTVIIQLVISFLSIYLNIWLGIIVLVLFIAMDILIWRLSKTIGNDLNTYISNLSYHIKRGEHEAIIKLPIGIVIYDENYEIEWMSPYLQSFSGSEESLIGKKVENVFEGIEIEASDEDNETTEEAKDEENKKENKLNIIKWRDTFYRTRVEEDINVLYLENVSNYVEMKDELNKNRSVVGWMFLDNYDEVTKGLDDRAISNFNSLLTTYLSNWARQHNIYYKRIENDKYLLLLRQEELNRLESEKFNIVNNIREYTSKRNLPLTISLGMSYGEASFVELANLAQKDLDLALGRGGDQAIVREVEQEPRYYGGNTNPMEKRTRVRSRMISEAVQEQMKQSPTTYVMGHKYPDMDSVGSALGIARIAMMLEQDVKVIIDKDEIGNDIQNLLNEIEKFKETNSNIISPEEAYDMITPEDLVVMVDHHKPSMSIAPDMCKKTKKVVVIDHHRRGDEFPEDPILVYIEPYASSGSELIAELFEYVSTDGNSINRVEATAMLGGIIVDTNNFSLRTGSRTFDAASYLQSVGANTTTIQRILKEDLDIYLERMNIIETFDFVSEGMAIAYGEENETHTQVIAAQSADTMLSMTDVEASFAIVRLKDNLVGISARSLGKINVQRIMEKLGGGGHLTNAATQIEDQTIEEVRKQLIEVIEESNT